MVELRRRLRLGAESLHVVFALASVAVRIILRATTVRFRVFLPGLVDHAHSAMWIFFVEFRIRRIGGRFCCVVLGVGPWPRAGWGRANRRRKHLAAASIGRGGCRVGDRLRRGCPSRVEVGRALTARVALARAGLGCCDFGLGQDVFIGDHRRVLAWTRQRPGRSARGPKPGGDQPGFSRALLQDFWSVKSRLSAFFPCQVGSSWGGRRAHQARASSDCWSWSVRPRTPSPQDCDSTSCSNECDS